MQYYVQSGSHNDQLAAVNARSAALDFITKVLGTSAAAAFGKVILVSETPINPDELAGTVFFTEQLLDELNLEIATGFGVAT